MSVPAIAKFAIHARFLLFLRVLNPFQETRREIVDTQSSRIFVQFDFRVVKITIVVVRHFLLMKSSSFLFSEAFDGRLKAYFQSPQHWVSNVRDYHHH